MLELARDALCSLLEVITFDRFIAVSEVVVIGVAAYLAFKVGKKQNQINENLLGLHLTPRVAVIFSLEEEKIRILNTGTSTVYMLELKGALSNDELASIQPGMEWGASVASLLGAAKNVKQNFKQSLFIKLSAVDEKKYILETTLYYEFEGDTLRAVRIQNYPIKECVE